MIIKKIKIFKNKNQFNFKKIIFNGVLLLILFSQINAFAIDYRMSDPQMEGNGCPEGTASATLSPDGKAISILFDKFALDLGPGIYHPLKLNRHCKFTIPIEVEPGYVLEATAIDYRGFSSIPENGSGSIATSGPWVKRHWTQSNPNVVRSTIKGGDRDIFERHLSPQATNYKCQEQKAIEFTTEISFRGRGMRGTTNLKTNAYFGIDSADLAQGESPISIQIRFVPCRN